MLFFAGLLASGFWAARFIPFIITLTEDKIGHTISYELHLRLYFAAIFGLLLLFYLLYSLAKKNRLHLFLGLLLLAGYAILPIIFIFDLRHSLIEEFSWIRYPSSLALLLAGLTFFLISRQFNRGEKWPAQNERVWLILSAGLVFAGLDEVAEIHEKIGYVLEKLLSLAHVTTDLITIFYFIIGLAVLIWLGPAFVKTFGEKSKFFSQTAFLAILLFGLAAFFDTFDGIILNQLRHFTDFLASRGFFFSDAWYIIYEPKRFLNGLEEILEYLSGLLFFGAGLTVLFTSDFWTKPVFKPRARKLIAAGGGLLALLLLLSVFALPKPNGQSPLADNGPAELLASVSNGLYHSDDLAYNEKRGIILANESHPSRRGQETRPAVFVWQNNALKKLADPSRLLADSDSVAANETDVYVSDGAQGKIFRWQNAEKGFEAMASRQNGLKTPEGLALLGKDLYILDEGEKTVSRLSPDGKITIDYPRHPLWQGPEGIIYHPGLKAFLITDDKTGVIFKYNFGEKLDVWADKKTGLKAPEDLTVAPNGQVLITDNGRGEVVIFSQDGKIEKTIRFKPLFRDLQGIALDNEGNIFVVSADSFAYASFMPSYLWRIEISSPWKGED